MSRQTVSNAVNNPDLLRADTLARVQEAIDELGYSPNRAARNLRTRASHLIGLRINAGPGGHGQRADGPLRALAGRGVARGRLPRAAVRRRPTTDPLRGYDDLLRSTAVDAFVVDRHLPRQPAGRLARDAAGAVRRLRPAVGRPRRHPSVGRRRRRRRRRAGHQPPARPRAHPDRLDRLAQGLPHRRGPPRGLEPRAARPAACRRPGSPRASRTRSRRGARPAPCSSTRPSPSAFVCASDTLAMGVLHTLAERGLRAGPATSPSSASTTPRSPRSCRPGLTSVRQPLEEVAVEVVKALEGLARPPAPSGSGVLLTPTLAVRGSS